MGFLSHFVAFVVGGIFFLLASLVGILTYVVYLLWWALVCVCVCGGGGAWCTLWAENCVMVVSD
jgi:hypothetical protein